MTIAIFGKSINKEYIAHLKSLFEQLNRHKIKILIHNNFYQHLTDIHSYKPNIDSTYSNANEIVGTADIMLSLGGDGTFLDSTTYIRSSNIPIMGINFGSLGFLANISLLEMSQAIDLLVAKRYIIESRSMVEVISDRNCFTPFPFGLNDFTIQKGYGQSMLHIATYIDNEFLCTYRADGLIISTPTGSTAYTLSVGGPILAPDLQALIISPIAPHNLTFRPIAISDNCAIRLEIESREKEGMLTLDSRHTICQTPTSISIKKANFNINIICIENSSFYKTLRGKMLWGIDKRN